MHCSIIIPTLNEAQTIAANLKSLQTFRNCCEIIVVDGGSVDKTVEIAKPLADKLITSAKGRAIQMNTGANIAQGNVLIFLHADTILPENAISLIQKVTADKQHWGHFDVKLHGHHIMLFVIAFLMNCRSRLTDIATGDQVIFASKTLFNSVGQYPLIPLMEDITLCKKLKGISRPICLSAKVTTSSRRWEHFGIFNTILLMWRLRLQYFLGADPAKLALLYKEGKFWKM
jgi:rSAM/selenodomain-associated transferase 2